MLKSFNLKAVKWNDPRVALRAVLGVLLAANLVAAVIAFKPFGGSVDDLRRESAARQQQLTRIQAHVADSQRLADKVAIARTQGDAFIAKYFADSRLVTSTIVGELYLMAKEAGVTYLPITMNPTLIEGSDTMSMMTINAGCQGTYAALSKFVNLLDRSERFLIVENMSAAPQQSGQNLNVNLKIDTFVNERLPGETP